MILRNLATRHGRKALAAPFQRTISTTGSQSSSERITQQTSSSTSATPAKTRSRSVRAQYFMYNRNKAKQSAIGSTQSPHYEPQKLVTQPPFPKEITLELLLASQTHMGHSTSLWNPANQRYIHGIRQGIHIISLEATAAHLRRAAKVVEGVAYQGGLILFVGTRPGQDRAVVKAAELSKGCHLFEKWSPGTITNADVLLSNCTMQAVDQFDEKIDSELIKNKLEDHGAIRPDLVVVLNPLENYVCLKECSLFNIPTIGVIDTDANPTWVTYPIPANDDSLRSTNLIAGILGRAGQAGQTRRLEAAKAGHVTFLPAEWVKLLVKSDPACVEQLIERGIRVFPEEREEEEESSWEVPVGETRRS